ncbi:MAG: glycosyltransferase family 2 protein [Candidatus Omnitrophota bacterium]|nr:glycosyltransferase family 2 protein [Candidatus Omnitrophota bacterium]
MKVTLVIPTFNEIDGMKAVMPKIKKEWVDQIIVVDGNSTDGTSEYAQSLGYPVVQQKLKGLVNAYQGALDAAIGDIIITFTPDGNSVPELIPPLVEEMKKGYDLVIVSRYLKGAKSYDDDVVTAFGNWMFTAMINVLFGGHYTDTLVGFRAWKKSLFQLDNRYVKMAGFEPLVAIRCAKQKLKVGEIPGDEPKRIGGIRKNRPLINGSYILLLILQEIFCGWHIKK